MRRGFSGWSRVMAGLGWRKTCRWAGVWASGVGLGLRVSGRLGFCSRVVAGGLGQNWVFWFVLRRLGRESVVGRGLDRSGLGSVRVAGVRASGWTSSPSPGYSLIFWRPLSHFRNVVLTSFFPPFFSVSESPSPPNSVFSMCSVRKGLILPDLRGFGNPTLCLPWPTVYNV